MSETTAATITHQINVIDFQTQAIVCAQSRHTAVGLIHWPDPPQVFTCLCGRYRWRRESAH